MIYMVKYFNGKKWINFIPFTVEEYAINFMDVMKKQYPDLDIIVKEMPHPTKYYLAAACKVDIAKDVKF